MTQQEKEHKIAYYLYEKGAKPTFSVFIPTEKVASVVGMTPGEVGSMFGNAKYFEFSRGTTVGLALTREGLDFVESKPERRNDTLIKWGTFLAALISAVLVVVQFFGDKLNQSI